MSHKTNRSRVRREKKARQALVSALVGGRWIEAAQARFDPMDAEKAARVAAAVADGLDLWAWVQGRVQFLAPADVVRAARFGLHDWIVRAVGREELVS